MPKLFRGAFWIGITSFITDISSKINQHPKIVKTAILISLNLAGFFCFWIIVYGLGLFLVPSPKHQDYALMHFGVRFVSFVIALLLSIGLYNLIRGIAIAGKFVSDKVSDVGKGLKDGGTVAVEIPKKVVDATRQAAEGTVELAKNAGVGVGAGIKKGLEIVKEKAPVVGEAILTVAQKTGDIVTKSSRQAASWSKENAPKAAQGVKEFTITSFRKIAGVFKKKGKQEERNEEEPKKPEQDS
jgi:hypothetical protein